MKLVLAKNQKYPLFVYAALFVALSLAGFIALFHNAHATTSGTSFQAGRIIDDAIFTNSGSMSVSQIQGFLNSKVTACDTNGSQPSEMNNAKVPDYNGDGTIERWEWGKYHYGQTTFPCLRDYSENGLSSAQIIYNVAQQYQINPQVLIVLLQKEEGLVTDTWPLSLQYKTATGYGCPDTAACDSTYYGFTNQVTWAAKLYHAVETSDPNWYSPYTLGNNTIYFNPGPYNNSTGSYYGRFGSSPDIAYCGSTVVNIQNRATQALYDYTPYQPDQAAMNAGYGTGDTCSSHGNLNFYLYFNDWFGNSILANLPGCDEATNTTIACIWRLSTPSGGEYLTSSNQLRDNLFVQNSYQYLGKAFFGNVVSMPGNIPVYRLTDGSGSVFLTANQTEYNALLSAGYKDGGIDFYAAPAGSNSGYPIYRLYNPNSGAHIWTASSTEQQQLLGYGYNSEGIAFTSIDTINQETPPPSGKTLVYRFYIPQTYSHFWTQDLNERDAMIRAGYNYEGVAWLGSAVVTSQPVYRLYSSAINQHLYTTDTNERTTLLNSGMWSDEGISEYVGTTANSSPVYRLYAPSLHTHLYTQDPNERQQLVASGGWNNEGIAWYQP